MVRAVRSPTTKWVHVGAPGSTQVPPTSTSSSTTNLTCSFCPLGKCHLQVHRHIAISTSINKKKLDLWLLITESFCCYQLGYQLSDFQYSLYSNIPQLKMPSSHLPRAASKFNTLQVNVVFKLLEYQRNTPDIKITVCLTICYCYFLHMPHIFLGEAKKTNNST